jgi:hypothetical protein
MGATHHQRRETACMGFGCLGRTSRRDVNALAVVTQLAVNVGRLAAKHYAADTSADQALTKQGRRGQAPSLVQIHLL